MKLYSVIQHLDWCCPGMLIAVDDTGAILWIQLNPKNDMTRMYPEDYNFEGQKFDPSDYKEVSIVGDF
jgi:hypothetical protein